MNQLNHSIDCWNNLGQDFWANRSIRQKWVHQYVIFPELLKLIKKEKHRSILDYGCGDGEFSNFLIKELPESNILAYDIAETMREQAKKQIDLNMVIDDLSEKKFDVICANMVIQDVEEPVDLLLELKEHLQIDGRILITIPHPVFSLIESEHLTTLRESLNNNGKFGIHRYLFEETEKVFWNKVKNENWTYLFNRTMHTYSEYFFKAELSIKLISEPLPIAAGICERDLYNTNSILPRTFIFYLSL